jgi:4-hydroxy-tetrahydrodipicolinate synthase
VFPGSEIFLLDGMRKGAAGCISATCNVGAAAIRHVYDHWQGPEADKLQADITALRKAIQAFPMIPALKALIAYYRQDSGWAKVRPPFVGLPAAEADKVIRTLAEAHGFKLDFAKAA